jgi:hypothetical protein
VQLVNGKECVVLNTNKDDQINKEMFMKSRIQDVIDSV